MQGFFWKIWSERLCTLGVASVTRGSSMDGRRGRLHRRCVNAPCSSPILTVDRSSSTDRLRRHRLACGCLAGRVKWVAASRAVPGECWMRALLVPSASLRSGSSVNRKGKGMEPRCEGHSPIAPSRELGRPRTLTACLSAIGRWLNVQSLRKPRLFAHVRAAISCLAWQRLLSRPALVAILVVPLAVASSPAPHQTSPVTWTQALAPLGSSTSRRAMARICRSWFSRTERSSPAGTQLPACSSRRSSA